MVSTVDAQPGAVEQQLIDAVVAGEVLDLAGAGPVDEAAMRAWGHPRTVRATVIRDLVRGRVGVDADPRGLRLRGARISGLIDLANITSDLAVELTDCYLPDGLLLRDCHLLSLVLDGCRIEQPAGSEDPPVDALRLTATLVSLSRSVLTASSAEGAVRLLGAHLTRLDLTAARMSNDAGPALLADSMRVEQNMFLRGGFEATGVGDDGAVRLLGAHVGGQLICDGARLHSNSGPALYADNLRVERDLFLSGGFRATGSDDRGAVRLLGAHLGELDCTGARLHNDSGPAVSADDLHVVQNVLLSGGFEATGNGFDGAVRLAGATIGGELDCTGARLHNDSGPALIAENLRVEQDILLSAGFEATGSDDLGVVRLIGARVGGELECSAVRLHNTSGPALHAAGLRVEQSLFLREGFRAAGTVVVVILSGVHVGGTLWLDTSGVTRVGPDGGALVDLDGLTYPRLPKPRGPVSRWLTLLREHTPDYAAQPYQQLAAVHRAAGHDSEARDILVAQRRDQIRRGGLNRRDRAWARFTGATLGFGYQPWRALLLLGAVLAVSITVAIAAGNAGGLAHPGGAAAAPGPCTTIEHIGVGLDLGLPLIKTGARDVCAPTDNPAGQALTIAGWLLQLLAWALATLFIAGFTSAVRRT